MLRAGGRCMLGCMAAASRRLCVKTRAASCEPVDSSEISLAGRGPLVYIKMQIKNECAYLNGKDLRYN